MGRTMLCLSALSQWMPSPFALNLQFFRSVLLAFNKRGNQARGAEIVRPSLSWTVMESSVMVSVSARGTLILGSTHSKPLKTDPGDCLAAY